ncbi:type IX secretion system membrane protein PorP/SprF [Pontibacter silvestris]|uniref:Type IX secretion system membrane protein PorP/SprF n=1 Tax=Pontibacter silvestris TaxID=2305183 RepID=A0ABW4X219_9BACT|nr:type IX secretion system membrane protein PorP/SprF [Pontibacter silvestris]MCC9135778.1 type IX secretion system membrane protein PorP/SprF [Pontibacter silvestris]
MKKLLLLFFIIVLGVSVRAVAQQRPQYSQYMLNNYILNPAVTGIEDYADIRLSTRRQWVGLDGAPISYYATAHTPLNKGTSGTRYHKGLAHHGVGATIHTDKTGPLRNTSLLGSYAYHMPVTRTINVSAGVSAGLIRSTVDNTQLEFTNPNDPLVSGGNINRNLFDLNLGLWVYAQNFSVGVSGAQLLENAGTVQNDQEGEATLELQRHYFITGAYRFEPTEELDVIPSVMFKLTNSGPTTFDANVRVMYDERFWVGASYRNKDALAAMVGLYISPLLDLSYSYDITTSELNQVSAGTHEIVLGFKLLNNRRIVCPQWIW